MNGTTTTSCHGACYLRGIKCICQKLNPDQIFLTSSTSEAYSFLFRLLTNPGDNVLIPCPSYPLFDFLGNLNDIELKPYKLAYENAWHIDFDSLSEAVTSKTRAILMVNPNNPTGSYIKEREIKKLVEFAKQNDLALISDEVFFDYDFENRTERMSFAQSSEVLTFTLNGLSKMAALPQMKLAWIVINGPESLVQEACQRLEVITDTYLSVNTPIQVALPEIFKHTKTIQIQIKKRLKTNLKTLQNTLQNFPTCECLKVEGGWYAILKIPKILTDEAWVLSLLEKESILIHPGHFYHFDQEGYLVLSLLPQTEIFTPAIEKILSYISEKS
ncbi:MAG: pyridoxal phosphate-dependent aminotransferase [Chlamydiae bacterium]|nr:pyridoxal phosphate-dependent aminotransferase [Chlamydiota bacterium]MBI3266368.1 pyridoxal phosphate-dependent aminotransferase [Chlamydiota bacterium]